MVVLMTREVAAMYISRVSSGRGVVMIGGFVKNTLSYSKAKSTSSDQEKRSEALRSLKKGSPFSPRRDMKRLKAAMQPVSFCISLMHVVRFMLVMAEILSRVGFDAMCADYVAQEYTGWNSKNAL